MAVRLVSFSFIPGGQEGSIFACRCGGISVYGIKLGYAKCRNCFREMALVRNVKPNLKSIHKARLKGIKGGKA